MTVDELVAKVVDGAQPCVRIMPGGSGRSRLGGEPDLSGPWPRMNGAALAFVAQIDLAEVRSADGPEWLPAEGRLMFFYSFEHLPWGAYPEDLGAAVAIYETSPPIRRAAPDDLHIDARFRGYDIGFAPSVSYPSEDRVGIESGIESGLSHADYRAFRDRVIPLSPQAPSHQIGGFPDLVQWDTMEGECEKIAEQLGWSDGSGAADWRLLLQVDTDEEADMMWADVGEIYFWVREADARAGDFSKVWMILQSN
jgi:hypothetical protein